MLRRFNLLNSIPASDLERVNDPHNVSEVAAYCTQHMMREEEKYKPTEQCIILNQPELKKEMRKTLVSWLVEVCMFFRLRSETWYISINIIDRYCDARKVSLKDY